MARKSWVDGRGKEVDGFKDGYFLHPTVVGNVAPGSEFAHTEIFGPVLSMMHAATVEEAIEIVNARKFGNQACLFTSSGAAARQFRYSVRAGNVGINLGVARADGVFSVLGVGVNRSLATCTRRVGTALSSTPKPRSWSSAGRRSGAGRFREYDEQRTAVAERSAYRLFNPY